MLYTFLLGLFALFSISFATPLEKKAALTQVTDFGSNPSGASKPQISAVTY